jgi:hypothetical protein
MVISDSKQQNSVPTPLQQSHLPLSIVEQLAQMVNKEEVMSLLEFKEQQQLDKNDPLWAFLLEFLTG